MSGKDTESIQTLNLNDLLRELQNSVRNFQASLDILSQKAVQADLSGQRDIGKSTQQIHPLAEAERSAQLEVIAVPVSNLDNDASDNVRLTKEMMQRFEERYSYHKRECQEMWDELGHLNERLYIVGGDKEVIKTSENVQSGLLRLTRSLEKVVSSKPDDMLEAMRVTEKRFDTVLEAVRTFHKSLYYQRHAFYFRQVKQWEDALRGGRSKIQAFLNANNVVAYLEYMHSELFTLIEGTMKGVTEELNTFGEVYLPTSLAEEKERATIRYVNITTIATFFSSVTATTLQLSFSEAGSALGGAVNLFWFLSLVFSVSSGISSLLGMSWRRSSKYHEQIVPPKLIRFWLYNAPMVCLIIAAVTFIIGLNLFTYLSLQPLYVSLMTNIFTGLHSTCILTGTAWFIYQLMHDNAWAVWIRKRLRPALIRVYRARCVLRWMRHLRRNIYWSFGMDQHVGRLNDAMRFDGDFESPYLLSKLIRYMTDEIAKCWLGTQKALFASVRFAMRLTCQSSDERHLQEDLEIRGSNALESAPRAGSMSESQPQETARDFFLNTLHGKFGEANVVQSIMNTIGLWEGGTFNNEHLQKWLSRKLWGYPEILDEFNNEVKPVLSLSREQNLQRMMLYDLEEWSDDNDPFPF